MAVPSEIRKLLGNRDVKAHASLSCSFQGPIGETHFILADGELFVFERESLIGEFRQAELDPAHPPKLEPGTFNDVLHVALADGTAHELQVSSFDRDSIKKLLEANVASPPGPVADAREQAAQETSAESHEDTRATAGSDEDGGQSSIDQLATTSPPPEQDPHARDVAPGQAKRTTGYTTPSEVDPDEAKESAEAAKAAEKRGDKNVYYGSDPGCAGCLMQALLFFGGIVAMWFAHEHAMLNIGVVEPTDQYDDSPVFVITKIVAVIAGMYLGGKSATLLGKLFQKLNWTGWIAFAKNRAVAIGQRGRWQVVIDSAKPFEFAGGAHSSLEATTDKQGRPNKRNFNVFIRVAQDGNFFTLKTSLPRASHPESVSGIPLKQLSEEWKDERLITMDNKTFRQVLTRLQNWQ